MSLKRSMSLIVTVFCLVSLFHGGKTTDDPVDPSHGYHVPQSNWEGHIGVRDRALIQDRADNCNGHVPHVHLVFDTAMRIVTRHLLVLLNPYSKFPNETYISISTFNGSDAGVGKHLVELCPPLNVVEDITQLREILRNLPIAFPEPVEPISTRDSGAAIRDAILLLSQYRYIGGSILYLATQYSEGGSIVKELEMVDGLLNNNIQLIGVELDDKAPNRLTNLNRIAKLTEGYHFPAFDLTSWSGVTNQNAANQLLGSSFVCVKTRRTVVFAKDHPEVSNVAVANVFFIPADFGIQTTLSIQSTEKGTVIVTMRSSRNEEFTFTTTAGDKNWNMVNSPLYVQSFDLNTDTTGVWRYSVAFQSTADSPTSNVSIQILSTSKVDLPEQTTITSTTLGITTASSPTVDSTTLSSTLRSSSIASTTEKTAATPSSLSTEETTASSHSTPGLTRTSSNSIGSTKTTGSSTSTTSWPVGPQGQYAAGPCEPFYYQISNGVVYTLMCSSDLVFNPTKFYCDWRWNVAGCQSL